MRAVVVDPDAHALRVTELPDPTPGPDQVLVRVRAAGLGFSDLAARAGTFSAGGPAAVPGGAELAGEITAVGSAVTGWRAGDRVMARGHGLAELAVVDANHLMAAPPEFSADEAGAAPTALLTAHDALMTAGQLRPGQSVLVHAATSGVGHIAVRMAAELGASTVFATSRSDHKLAELASICGDVAGRVHLINTSTRDFADEILAHTDGRGVDVVVDLVGASVLAGNLSATTAGGRIVQVGRLGGKSAAIDLDELARQRLALVGVSFRTRTPAHIAALVHACADSLAGRYGALRPHIHRSFPMADASAAYDALERADFVGKIVIHP
jgi:NADPH:quinone reductase-like Zn-dependent oxidoreductase